MKRTSKYIHDPDEKLKLLLTESNPDRDLVRYFLESRVKSTEGHENSVYSELLSRYQSGSLDSLNLLRHLVLYSSLSLDVNSYDREKWSKEFLKYLTCDNENLRYNEIQIKEILQIYNRPIYPE